MYLGLNVIVWCLCHSFGVKKGSVTIFPPRTTNLARGAISASITSIAEFPLLISCLSIGRRTFLLALISAGNFSFIPTFEPFSLKAFFSTLIFFLNPRKFHYDGARSVLSEEIKFFATGAICFEDIHCTHALLFSAVFRLLGIH